MSRTLRLLFLLLLLWPCTVFSRECSRKAERYYQSALRYQAAHHWPEAESRIIQAIKECRKYAQAYSTYGDWLMERQQYAAAAAVLTDAEKLCKDGRKIFAKPLAKALLYSGERGQAMTYIPKNSKDTFWRKLEMVAKMMGQIPDHRDSSKPEPVGPLWGINTPQAELFPILSEDGKTFYFTRRVNGMDEDFYYTVPDTCGGWQSARNMGSPPNTLQQEAAQFISADGHYLFFMRCDNRSLSGWDQGGCDLLMAYRADSIWSVAQSFGGTINSPGYEGMPCLSSDNRELYFVSDRPGGYGGLDIWSSRFEHGLWQAPRNLGPEINSAGNETAPFIYADNATMYFASDGKPGIGGSDFFISRRVNDTTWTEAAQIGLPFNTPFDEASLSLNAAGDTAFFSSDRDSAAGNFDIYQTALPPSLRPGQVMYLKGHVYDSIAKVRLNYANIYITDSATGTDLYQVQSNRGDGSYTIALPVGHTLHFLIDRVGYQSAFDTVHVSYEDAGFEQHRNYRLLPYDYQAPVHDSVVGTYYFVKNSVDVSDSLRTSIESAVAPWINDKTAKIFVNGYTDNTGTPLLNEQLSSLRAKLIADVFRSQVQSDRLQVEGWGEADPIAENDTDEHRDQNRRVEIVIRK
jgi:outer membrane protein OmpA-like peptidoglycan-associated protein